MDLLIHLGSRKIEEELQGKLFKKKIFLEHIPLWRFSKKEFSLSPKEVPDWIWFTSRQGVVYFMESQEGKQLLEMYPDISIGCVGKETRQKVLDYGYYVDFIPSIADGIHFAKEWESIWGKTPQTIFHITAPYGNHSITKEISSIHICKRIYVYEGSVDRDQYTKLKKILRNKSVYRWIGIIVTSKKLAESVLEVGEVLQGENISYLCMSRQVANVFSSKGLRTMMIEENRSSAQLIKKWIKEMYGESF